LSEGPIRIVAGNHREFKYYCRDRGLKDAVYVSSREGLLGLQDDRSVIFIEGAWQNPNFGEIWEVYTYLKTRRRLEK